MQYPNAVMTTIEDVLGWDLPDAAVGYAIASRGRRLVEDDGED